MRLEFSRRWYDISLSYVFTVFTVSSMYLVADIIQFISTSAVLYCCSVLFRLLLSPIFFLFLPAPVNQVSDSRTRTGPLPDCLSVCLFSSSFNLIGPVVGSIMIHVRTQVYWTYKRVSIALMFTLLLLIAPAIHSMDPQINIFFYCIYVYMPLYMCFRHLLTLIKWF